MSFVQGIVDWWSACVGSQAEQFAGATGTARSCAGLLAGGFWLTCLGSNPCSRVITAHRIRAFLLAIATHAFCQPTRATSCTSQREVGSSRLPALMTTDLAPWIISVRR